MFKYMDTDSRQKEYYKRTRAKWLKYYKQYKIDNKDAVTKYSKDYYQKNKNKYTEMVHCDACDRSYAYSNMSKHRKTTKHKKNIND